MTDQSPFALRNARPIPPAKFADPLRTATGEERAAVQLKSLDTLWFNTGTLCNLTCKSCYIESSPINDALVYLSLDDVRLYLDEIIEQKLPTSEIAFTGGEPFMNPEIMPMLQLCLDRGFDVLVLTNAMQPMRRLESRLLELQGRAQITMRVSLDHYSQSLHEAERGRSWIKAMDGLQWLAQNDFPIAVAGRQLAEERQDETRKGYARLFAAHSLPIDAYDPAQLVLFPEVDATADIAEITTACWNILDVSPDSVMCASSRMVVKRKGESAPRVASCTLLPYHREFDLGSTLAEARRPVHLNHPHCARFCVLGGASCSA